MDRFLTRVIDVCVMPGRLAGWIILPLIVFVWLTVFAAQMGLNAFIAWEGEAFVLGDGITVNTLTDLQWGLFAIMVLFGGSYAFRDDAHVAVDFVSGHFSDRGRMVMRLLGDLLFLLPLCIVVIWFGTKFAMTSFASGEGSTYGGLQDRWVVKACVPLGFALLGLAGACRALRTALRLARGHVELVAVEPAPTTTETPINGTQNDR